MCYFYNEHLKEQGPCCVFFISPSRWKVLHEYSAGAGGGNDVPKVTQTQTPFSALSTSLSVSFPFHIQHRNDHNSLSSRLVTALAAQKPREWKKKDEIASLPAPGTCRVPRGFLKALNAVYFTWGDVSYRQCGLVGIR